MTHSNRMVMGVNFNSHQKRLIKRAITLVCFLNYMSASAFLFTPVIEVSQGKLRGFRGNYGQSHFYSVPYATAKRFQYPQEPQKWKGTYFATNRFIRCPQIIGVLVGREDCLYLDIHVPNRSQEDKFPVLVFFHGGAFWHGQKNPYQPLILDSMGVIVVTINYRLGVLGFLCLNNISNIGLRDQVAALKWIRKNIKVFGGDPDNITICGQSAGGSLASMHLLSDLSKGMFHKAIFMSGTALSTWAFNVESHKTTLIDANKIAPAKKESDIYEIFSQASIHTLMQATKGSSIETRYFRYSPCIDHNNTNSFFSNTPYNILKFGHLNEVPTMIGYTDLEGMFFYALSNRNIIKEFNNRFSHHLPSPFSQCSKKEKRKISNKIRSHYFGNTTINFVKHYKSIIRFYSDWISYGTSNAYSKLLTQVSSQPVYNYEFSYIGRRNIGKEISGVNIETSTHSDDLFYIFKPIELPLSERDEMFIETFNRMIGNFLKYGNPTPDFETRLPVIWPPATTNSSNVMVLDENLTVLEEPKQEHRGEFFLKMLCTYGISGYVPCESAEQCGLNDRL